VIERARRRTGVDPDSPIQDTLTDLYGPNKLWKTTLQSKRERERFRGLEDARFKRNNELRKELDKASKSGDMAEVRNIFRQLERGGALFGDQTFTMLMSSAARAGDVVSISVWFNKMQLAGYTPSMVEYLIAMAGCAEAGEPNLAENWYLRMVNNGYPAGNRIVYKALMAAMLKGKTDQESCFQRAVFWYNRMTSSGIFPDVNIYNILMEGAAATEDIEQVERVFKLMMQRGIFPNISTFKIMLRAAFKTNDAKFAKEWFDQMRLFRTKSERAFCLELMQHFQAAGLTQNMEDILDYMSEIGLPPQTEEYESVISAYADEPNPDAVESVFQKFVAGGAKPSADMMEAVGRGVGPLRLDALDRQLRLASTAEST
jgi:pentatricopeptide repeat protein